MKYRTKPKQVDAWQWMGRTLGDFMRFRDEAELLNWSLASDGKKSGILINGVICERGSWIVWDGKYTVMTDEEFHAEYEAV